MHVSVTPLGSKESGAPDAAGDVVRYLTGQGRQAGRSLDGPDPALAQQTGPGGYYADSAEQPGRWIGRGAERLLDPEQRKVVQPEQLERALLGQDPRTGEQLVGARGSSGRVQRERPEPLAGDGNPDDLLTVAEVAQAAGVDPSHIRRLLNSTAQIQENHSDPGQPPEYPKSYLHGSKVDQHWLVRRDEAQRFIGDRSEARVVLGYDLTYSVPKSVSIAWAASDEDGRQAIESALHEAVDGSLKYIEDNAIKVRVNRAQVDGDGMLAAAFLHDTSRELEPQLHMHVVVANMAATPSGEVRALDGRAMFAHGTTSGYLAEAEIQSILNKQGYRFTKTEKGIAHLEAIPQEAVDAMSSRRTQILEEVGALGVDSAAARQNAAYRTRAEKRSGVDRDALEQSWSRTLDETGMTKEQLAIATSHDPALLWTPHDSERLTQFLSGRAGVAMQTGIFDRRDVIQSITDHVGGRLNAVEVQREADQWLGSEAVIELRTKPGVDADFIGHQGRVSLAPGTTHYTTPQVIAIEQAVFNGYTNGLDQNTGQIGTTSVEAAVDRWQSVTGHQLGDDQLSMISSITSSGHRFQAVVGPAGSGKTAALEVAARAWEAEGYTVIGASVNGNAAEVLTRATDIETSTVASLLARLDYDEHRPPPRERLPVTKSGRVRPQRTPTRTSPLDERTILLVDEASTLSNREHAELIRHVERTGATMRTIGDPLQHHSVEAGGAWAEVVQRHAAVTPELTENRRMSGEGMADVRLAAEDYRKGQIAQALRRLEQNQRVVTAPTSEQLLDSLAADWYVDWRRHLDSGGSVESSRMLAEHHVVRRELNERAQVLLKADGVISSDGVRIGEATFHVGDQVIARQQNKNLRPNGATKGPFVKNGTQGVVVGIRQDNGGPSLQVDFVDRGVIDVPHSWLTKPLRPGVVGGLAPAYAMTTHGAQGETLDSSRAVLTDQSSARGQYIGLTRGRNDLRLYAVDASSFAEPNPALEHNLPVATDRRTLEDRIEARLARPEPTDLATVADAEIADAVAFLRMPVRELDKIDSPIAQRAIDERMSRAQNQALRNPPVELTTLVGPASESADWKRAVRSHAEYRERWGADPLLSVPQPGHRPESQIRDHQRAGTAIAKARSHQHANTPAKQLAANRQELTAARSDSTPIDSRTRDALLKRLAERERMEAALVAELSKRHETALKPVNGRIDPDDVERKRRSLERAQGELAETQARRRDLRLITGDTSDNSLRRHRLQLEIESIDHVVQRRASEAINRSSSYITDVLGNPPNNAQTRASWDRAACKIESYRIRHLGVDSTAGSIRLDGSALARAIGNRPPTSQVDRRRQWDLVAKASRGIQRGQGMAQRQSTGIQR